MIQNSLLSNPIFQNRVFFPTNLDKTPKVPHWKENALNAAKATQMWGNEAGWAMPTGNGILVVDVDTKNGGQEEDVYKLGFPMGTFRVKTPSGGCHLYYKDVGLGLKNSVQKLGKGIDIRADGGYVCVPPMPGYEVTCDHEPKTVVPFELKLPAAPEPVPAEYSGENETFEEGTRNSSLFTIGCSLRARGLPESAISAALHAMNKENCNPPLPTSEVNRIVESVLTFQMGELHAGKGPELQILTAAEIEDREGEAKETFIWESHILDAMPNLLYAEGGMGKTTLSLLISQEVLKNDPNTTVLWIPAENNLQSTRIQMKSFDIDMNRFAVLGRAAGGYSVDFAKPEDMAELARLMAMQKPKLVVIDSLSSMSSADINSNAIRGVMKNVQDIVCEQHKASLIYIHHENKSDMASERNKSMGSNMIMAQVRSAFRITAGSKPNTRLLTNWKYNLTQPGPIEIVAHEDGTFSTEAAATEASTDEIKYRVEETLRRIFNKEMRVLCSDAYKILNEDDIYIPQDISNEELKTIRESLRIRYTKDDKGNHCWAVNKLLNLIDSE